MSDQPWSLSLPDSAFNQLSSRGRGNSRPDSDVHRLHSLGHGKAGGGQRGDRPACDESHETMWLQEACWCPEFRFQSSSLQRVRDRHHRDPVALQPGPRLLRLPRRVRPFRLSLARRAWPSGPETVVSLPLDSIRPSLVQMACPASQPVFSGRVTVTAPFPRGLKSVCLGIAAA